MVKIRQPYITSSSVKVPLLSPKKLLKSDDVNIGGKWQVTHTQRDSTTITDTRIISNITKSNTTTPLSKATIAAATTTTTTTSSSNKSSSKSEKKIKVVKKVSKKPTNMQDKILCSCGGYYSSKMYYGYYANSAKENHEKTKKHCDWLAKSEFLGM
jgi:hypothetical protein